MKNLTKKKTWRCNKYIDWVKTQPRCVTGLPSDDAHHIKGHGFSGTTKAPDWATIPLTRQEHTHLHYTGYKRWEQAHGSQLEHVARTLGKAIEDGIISYEP